MDGLLANITELFRLIIVYDKLKAANGNIVMIGANGSGKSTFARSLKGKLASNMIVISAQYLLVYKKDNKIVLGEEYRKSVTSFQTKGKLHEDNGHDYLSDYQNLISCLIINNIDNAEKFYKSNDTEREKYISIFEKVQKLWATVISNKEIYLSNHYLMIKTDKEQSYDFNKASDGEKAVLYYAGHVLLAPSDSYIIIDEPEKHLHLAICNKLWDALERERQDCKFIYITHSMDFASSRNDATLIWNKNFSPPLDWDIEIIEDNENIPRTLLMELLGSKKKILFCEGNDKSSIDYKIYSILFNNYTVIPVGGHFEVINHCNAFNASNYGNDAIGIIDGDFHLTEQIKKWRSKKIFVLDVNEIENLICDKEVLKKAISHFSPPDSGSALNNFEERFFEKLSETKKNKATEYAQNKINNMLKGNMLKEKREIINLKKELTSIVNEEVLQGYYDEYLSKINTYIDEQNFDMALRWNNMKKIVSKEIANKLIVNDYEIRVIQLIKNDAELQMYLKDEYFSEID